MNSERKENDRFDLLDVNYLDEERVILLGIAGNRYQINLKKMVGGPNFMPWVISSSDVRDAFGDCYVEGLSAFIGRLADKCYSMKIRLPLHQIDVSDVETAAEKGADFLNDLVKRTIESADGHEV